MNTQKLTLPSFPENSIYIAVEGNIGSGKSTFLKKIHETFSLPIVLEPHALWQNINGHNLLQAFYDDISRWAYSFQTYVFLSRLKSLEEAIANHNRSNSCFIMERSVYTDKYCFARACYESGFMSDLEWSMYCSWYDWLILNYVKKPAGIIYLQVNPEISYARTRKRNREEENEVSLDYIKLLHSCHEDWLIHKKNIPESIKNIPVLTLDCNEDFEHTDTNWNMLCDKSIKGFIQGLQYNFQEQNSTYTYEGSQWKSL